MASILIDGVECEGGHVRTDKSNILLLQGRRGLLGCGYFDGKPVAKLPEGSCTVRIGEPPARMRTLKAQLSAKP